MRHLDVSIPFRVCAEGKDIGPGCSVTACARLRRADTRAVNPRKVLVRAEAAVEVTVFTPMTKSICSQVPDAAKRNVEQLTETQEVYLTACVQEKPFTISEEVALSASKPAAAELLKSRITLCRGESKIIGNKLIFKGSVDVSLLYRGEDDGVYTAGGELPFSQIMEVSGVGEGADCDILLTLSGGDCALTGGEGRMVGVSLDLLAQAVIREPRALEALTDAYSTGQPLDARRETYPLARRVDGGVRSQNAREVWETGTPVREVTDCRLTVGQVVRSREGERLILTAQTEVTILYTGEDGELYAAQRQVAVPCALDLPEECQCFCQCEGVGEVYAAPAAGGLEVRFTLDFRYRAQSRQQITALSSLEPGEPREGAGDQPSLVLRMLEQGERLWDVAKAYATTIADIISANELEDEAAAAGKLLLIPRKR